MQPIQPTLITQRLTLTPLAVTDTGAMFTVYADERMYEFTGGSPPNAEQLRARYERLAVGWNDAHTDRWCNWIVRVGQSAAPAGAMQATVASDLSWVAVAWEISTSKQGMGLASEAAQAVVNWLREIGVTTITASIHPDHTASMRVAARVGMTPIDELDDGEIVWRLPGTREAATGARS